MAKSLAQVVDEVYEITKRPALASETVLAVKNATLKLHQMQSWPRDIFEISFQFGTLSYKYSLDYKALIPNFRDLIYLRKLDRTATPPVNFGPPLQVISPSAALDSYNQTKTDVCYLSGALLQIYTSADCDAFTLGCYIHPNVTDASYSSWIADDFSYVIADEAARRIFMIIGKDEEAARYEKICMEDRATLVSSALILGGNS